MSEIKVNAVSQVSEILQQMANGNYGFKEAMERIKAIDLKGLKETQQTLTLDIPLMFFARTDSRHLELASIGGTEALIEKRAIDEFSKARLIWKLKLKDIEMDHMKRVIEAYESALDKYGHFEDKDNEKN